MNNNKGIKGARTPLPESFTSMKAKMNSNVANVIKAMNLAINEICLDEEVKAKDKLKATQDYLAMYMRLENEIQRERDGKENYKQNKLTTMIKQHQLDKLDDPNGGIEGQAIQQSKFSPTMSGSVS